MYAYMNVYVCTAGMFRASERMRERANSAAEVVFPPGVLNTVTPMRDAAGMSILFTPVPMNAYN